MKKRNLIIIGAGGHGRVVRDIARSCGYKKIDFLDDAVKDKISTLGDTHSFEKYKKKYAFFVAIGDSDVRASLMGELEANGCEIVTLVHPRAVVSADATLGVGSVVMAGAVVGTGTTVGKGAIINTNSAVDHDCIIGDFSHVSVGVSLGGGVSVGSRTWMGAGATVINNIKICEGCMIAAGAVVVRNITESGTYIGVPARLKEQRRNV